MKMAYVRKRVAFHKLYYFVLVGSILFPLSVNAQQRSPVSSGSIEVQRKSVYTNYTPQQLVEEIFVKKGGCASVSNITYKGHGWDPVKKQWKSTTNIAYRGLGYFSKGSSIFQMEEGLVLTTGDITSLEGPNDEVRGTMPINDGERSTDVDLEGLIKSGMVVVNVSVLEFDFVPSTNRVTFRYRFGSEEYPEFAGSSWNDVFGFFISKKGSSEKTNIARLPDNTIVAINNVNDGYRRAGAEQNCRRADDDWEYGVTPAKKPHNRDLYVRIPGGWSHGNDCDSIVNDFGDIGIAAYKTTELNGLTVRLEATAEVVPCETYHMKLAIANVGRSDAPANTAQSAVFLEANSFDIGGHLTNYGNGIENMDILYKGCDNNKFRFSRSAADNTDLSISFTYEGTAANGVDITTLDGQPLPSLITIPANSLYVDIPYKVPKALSGEKYLDIVMNCPCGEGNVKKRLWIYEATAESGYNVKGISSCEGNNDNSIQVSATGGSGHHQASLDKQSWFSLPYTFQNLVEGDYTVSLRDSIGCNVYAKAVSVGALVINAGEDQASCDGMFTMDAPAINTGEAGEWTVVSGMAGITNKKDPKSVVRVVSESAVLKWTLTSSSCIQEGTVTLTVKPAPHLSSSTAFGVCSGKDFTYTATSTIDPTTFGWTRAEVSGITNPSSGGSTNIISETLVNTTSVAINVPYTIALTANGCTAIETVIVTVHPRPKLQVAPPSSICSGDKYSYSASFDITGTTIHGWLREAVEGITPSTGSGTTGLIEETLTNTTNAPIDVTYKLSYSYFGCSFTEDIVVRVKPIPILTSSKKLNNLACNGREFTYTAESNINGTTFSWTRGPIEGIDKGAASGSSEIITETLINTTANEIVLPYTITLTADGCVAIEVVEIILPPQAKLYPSPPSSVCSGEEYHYVISYDDDKLQPSGWERNTNNDIAPPRSYGLENDRFEIKEIMVNKTNAPIDVTYRVSHNQILCANVEYFTVTVYPKPKLTSKLVTDPICSGTMFSYTPTCDINGFTYTWERLSNTYVKEPVTTGINMPIDEIVTTTGSDNVEVSYKITLEANGCTSEEIVKVGVKPAPTVTSSRDLTTCSGSPLSYSIETRVSDPNITWSRAKVDGITPETGSGTSGIISETLNNATAVPIDVTYIINTEKDGCTATENLVVTVNPVPAITSSLTPPAICSGSLFSYTPESNMAGTTITWERQPTANIEPAPSGSSTGAISEQLSNIGATPIEVTYKLTFTSSDGCKNLTPYQVKVTVNPSMTLSSSNRIGTICSGAVASYSPSSSIADVEFEWVRVADPNIEPPPSSGPTSGGINEKLINKANKPVEVSYIYTLKKDGCTSSQQVVKVEVNPKPYLTSSLTPPAQCSGIEFYYIPTSDINTAVKYQWSRPAIPNISSQYGESNSGENIVREILANKSNVPIEVVYYYTSSAYGCDSTQEVKVTVNPTPSTYINSISVCNGSRIEFEPKISTSADVTSVKWTRQPVEGVTPGGDASGSSALVSEQLENQTREPKKIIYKFEATTYGCTVKNDVQVTINPIPALVSSPVIPPICSGGVVQYTPVGDVSGSKFSWMREYLDNGIKPEAAANMSTVPEINEQLFNESDSPQTVKYHYNVTANKCSKWEEVTVVVNPIPTLTTSKTPPDIYSGETFVYKAKSNMASASYSWQRDPISGINGNTGGAGSTADISEVLENETGNPVEVIYKLTLSANSCSNTEEVKVVVQPKAELTSSLNPPPICSGDTFDYTATSSVSGVTFSWVRAAIPSINGNAGGAGSSAIVNEKLESTDSSPVTVTYRFKLEVGTSVSYADVKVAVKPKPTLSSKAAAGICSGSEFSYTATTDTKLGNIIGWKREPVVGISNAGASGGGATVKEMLVNTASTPVEVIYVFSLEADGCVSEEEVKVTVTLQPLVSIKDATADEGEELEFEVVLSGLECGGGSATVDYTAINGTAVAPDDYIAANGTLTFAPGETSKKVVIQTKSDDIIEDRENMIVRLSSPVLCQLSGGSATLDATGTIEDQTEGLVIVEKYEPEPDDTPASEPSTGGSFRVRFKNKNVTCVKDIKVQFTLSGAELEKDFTVENSAIVKDSEAIIKAGENGVVIPIKIKDNYIVQGSRKLTMTLTKVELIEP